MTIAGPKSSIPWFYYDNFAEATAFYSETLGLERVLDQGWAHIFRIAETAFVGLVDANAGKGSCQTQEANAVLLTLIVDDVPAWHKKLTKAGATIDSGVVVMEEIEIRTFFLTDPGGYKIEIQEFLNAEPRAIFH